jgi:mannose-1-phosphate guanylyltransferase/phosphomannomutase
MKAIIMAGGEGTRLRPLTSNQPKPMVPVINKPVMEHIIELLKKHGIVDIVATLQFLSPLIKTYFGDGADLGVHISYATEESPLGTAGSVKNVQQHIDDTFIVISGDALTDIDLTKAIEFHKEKKSATTLILKHVENPLQFGVVVTKEDGRIDRFLEKPTWGQVLSDTVNTGIYILEPSVLKLIPENTSFDFSKDLFPKLMKSKKPMYGFIAEGYWCDIGDLDQYLKVQHDILAKKTDIEPEGFKIGRSIWVNQGAQIDPMADIKGPVIIGKHAKIEAGARVRPYTVIGNNTVIKTGAFVHRSIIWDNVYVGPSSHIRGCVIGRNCDIKQAAKLDEGVAIGDNCVIGKNAVIHPNVRIYPFKSVDDSAAISTSIIWETRGIRSLFGRHGISGLINIDVTPRLAMRVAVAYGTALPVGSTIAISCDQIRAAQIIKQAVMAGLNSTGINCRDLEHLPTPVTRATIISEHLAGGIDIRLSVVDSQTIEINFIDPNGIDIREEMQTEIEKYFYRGDFRRAFYNEMGDVIFNPRTVESYVNNLMNYIDEEAISKERLKVVIDYEFGRATQVAPQILGKLGLGIIALNAFSGEGKAALNRDDLERMWRQVSTSVRALKADFGVLIDSSAERLTLIDEKGQRVSQSQALVLMTKLFCEQNPGSHLVMPLSVSNVIDKLAEQNDCEVTRVRISPASLMEAAQQDKVTFAGAEGGGYIFPKFLPAYDGIMSLCKLIEILAKVKKPVSSLVASLPRYYVVHRQEFCPWEKKGMVMRQIIEMAKDKKHDMIDGIKIHHRGGWGLLLPDPVEPVYHVYTEGMSQTQADNIALKYSRMIKKLRS